MLAMMLRCITLMSYQRLQGYTHILFISLRFTDIFQGIAPTLLVGRVAAGHARPDDSWQGSIVSSLHFGTRLGGQNSQQDTTTSWDEDLEAQWEIDDEFDHRTLAYFQADTANEGVIRGDVIEERPEDHPSAILITPRDQ